MGPVQLCFFWNPSGVRVSVCMNMNRCRKINGNVFFLFYKRINEKPVQQVVRRIELCQNVCFGLNRTFLLRRELGAWHERGCDRAWGFSLPCFALTPGFCSLLCVEFVIPGPSAPQAQTSLTFRASCFPPGSVGACVRGLSGAHFGTHGPRRPLATSGQDRWVFLAAWRPTPPRRPGRQPSGQRERRGRARCAQGTGSPCPSPSDGSRGIEHMPGLCLTFQRMRYGRCWSCAEAFRHRQYQ